MPKTYLPNAQQYLIAGSEPSIFAEISNSMTMNYLVLDDSLVPSFGKSNPQNLGAKIRKFYKSKKEGVNYIIAGNIGYRQSNQGNLERLFTLAKVTDDIQIAENLNNELAITTGAALYIYNYLTGVLSEIGEGTGFLLKNPNSVIMIDTFFFVSDSLTSSFQIGRPNNGIDFTNNVIYVFNSEPGLIATLSDVDRTLYVTGNNAIERWVVVGGEQIVNRDNVFLLKYGLSEKNSYADKLNMIIGIFASNDGGFEVKLFGSGMQEFQTISTPGIVKKMRSSGACLNADIYEIDGNVYYEVVFTNQSFIYNFTSKTWTEATSPFEQVTILNGTYYGALGNTLYQILPYQNDQKKYRYCQSAFVSPAFKRFTVGKTSIWYSNPQAETSSAMIGASLDGINNIVEVPAAINGLYYGLVSREFNVDCFQFNFMFETFSNARLRAFTAEVEING